MRFESRVLAAFAAAALVVALLGAITWKISRDAVDSLLLVSRTHEVLDRLAQAKSETLQIELSTQSYRVTGDAAHTADRDAAIAAREAVLRRLAERVAGDTRQRERFDRLRQAIDERLAIAARVVQLRRTEGEAAANAYVAAAPLRETRARVFGILHEMDTEETRQLEERNAAQARARTAAVGAGALAALAVAALLAATYVFIRRQTRAAEAARRALETANAELAVATEQARQADHLKSAFLATMSHELRTPLNSIIGFSGILADGLAGPLNAEQVKQLGMVRASARHLLALINDVLDISKIEAGELQVAAEPFDLRASIERVTHLVGPLAQQKRLALRSEIAPGVGAAVGDARRVEQILLNLLNNAIKFTERGEVSLSAARNGETVRLQVADTGIGIRPEDLNSLFQPFRQVDDGLARAHEGTGLGLAICRRLADLMGGEIGVESEWGKGSTFCVTLPLRGGSKP